MINGNWKAGFLWDGRHKSIPEQGCSTGLYDMYNTNLFTFRGTLSRGTRFFAVGNPCIRKHAPTREIRSFASTFDRVESGLQTIGVTNVGGW